MAAVGTWNWNDAHQGYDYVIRFTFPSGIDLTGYTAEYQVRRAAGAGGPAYVTLTTGGSGITVGVDGAGLHYVELTFTDTQMNAIPRGKSEQELKLTSSGGSDDYGFKGTVNNGPKVIA